MSDNDEEEYESDGSNFENEDDSESELSSSSEAAMRQVEKLSPTGNKRSRKSGSAAKKTSNKDTNTTKNSSTKNSTKTLPRVKPSKQPKVRKVTEIQVVERPSKRQRVIERQVRIRMANAAAEEQDDAFTQEAVEKTVFVQQSRSEAYKISKINVATMRHFVWDKGLVGPSQPELLDELLEEIGVEERDEVAIREKVKTKVCNVNRTRREFYEMIDEDDIDDVAARLVNAIKSFGARPGALQKVKEAVAAL
jgi:hypothetical protein